MSSSKTTMARLFLCIVATILLSGSGAQPVGPTLCEQALEPVMHEIEVHQMDGNAERDAIVARLDALSTQFGRDGSECVLTIATQRGRMTNFNGHYSETIEHAQGVVPVGGSVPYPDVTATFYNTWATALKQMGRSAEARQIYVANARLVPRLSTEKAIAVLRTLATQAQEDGDWALAERTLNRALTLVRDSIGMSPDVTSGTYGRLLGDKCYLFQQMASEQPDPEKQRHLSLRTRATADSALSLMRAFRTDNPVERNFYRGRQALVLMDVAYAEAVLGEHATASARLDASRALLSPVVQQMFTYALSDYWMRRSQTAQMASRLDEAATAAEQSRATCDPDAAELLCEAATAEQMASVAADDRRNRDAERLYREAIDLYDVEWEQLRFEDWSASGFALLRSPYQGLSRVLVREGRATEAFVVLDKARARALRDIRIRQHERTRLSPAQRLRADSLLAGVHEMRMRYVTATLSVVQKATLQDSISRIQDEISDGTQQHETLPASLDVAALQQTLGSQRRTLVSYLVSGDSTLAFVVTADTLAARTLYIDEGRIEKEMKAAGGAWAPGETDPALRLAPLNRLYAALIAPIADLFRDGDGLVVISEGSLADLPFGMLVETPAQDYATARFLIRSRAISTDLAASLILDDAGVSNAPFTLDLAAFGRSRFDGAGGTFRSRSGPLLANLPYVVGEINRVESHVGNREAVMNDKATEAEFRATATHARIVHIASHAEADPQYPLNSRIYLWGDPGAGDDGILHLFELQDLAIPADLVVLSGCSTAAGQAQPGEGTIGLQYGVRAAGARATVATLWAVDDRATAEIVDVFYKGLATGLPKDRALQQAQLEYLDGHSGSEASPYLWAATVLSGSPAPIPIEAPVPMWPWAAGALALGAGGLAWHARRRPTDA